jgi:hypothetical protein
VSVELRALPSGPHRHRRLVRDTPVRRCVALKVGKEDSPRFSQRVSSASRTSSSSRARRGSGTVIAPRSARNPLSTPAAACRAAGQRAHELRCASTSARAARCRLSRTRSQEVGVPDAVAEADLEAPRRPSGRCPKAPSSAFGACLNPDRRSGAAAGRVEIGSARISRHVPRLASTLAQDARAGGVPDRALEFLQANTVAVYWMGGASDVRDAVRPCRC